MSRAAVSVTRRDLVRNGGVVAISASLVGCDALSTSPSEEEGSGGQDKGTKAPSLAQRVQDEELPSVDDRLPEEPLVVEPIDEVGVYGGSLNLAFPDSSPVWLYRTIGYEMLVNFNPQFDDIVFNIARNVEIIDDGMEYVFELRPGMKWSDGEPFTADDILFAYEDVLQNEALTQMMPDVLMTDAGAAEVTKEDDYTVRVTFPSPNGMFLQELATSSGGHLIAWPKHYLETFHEDYNPDIDQVVENEGASSWVELFDRKASLAGLADMAHWQNIEKPVLGAWVLTSVPGESDRVVAERNPYYWKVDPDGSQLPYFDEVVFSATGDDETLLLRVTSGDVDLETGYVNSPENKPVLARTREEGSYDFFEMIPSAMNHSIIALNLSCQDPVLREVFQNKDFRIGLSYAINRSEMIDAVFQQQGEPWQACPREDSGYYIEELAKQYTEFDVDLANEHLDRAGFTERDGDGFRIGPDGEKIVVPIETTADDGSGVDHLTLIRQYWEEVGVEMRIDRMDRSRFYDRYPINDHVALVWGGDPGIQDTVLSPRWYMPTGDDCLFAVGWGLWYNSGGDHPRAVEPPEAPKEQMRLYDQLKATPDQDEQYELMMEIMRIAQEEFYCIGTALPAEGYGVIKNDLGNVYRPMPGSWQYPTPGPSRPEQYYRISG